MGLGASRASRASQPYQAMGYEDGFGMGCVTFCVTPVCLDFRDGGGDGAMRKGRAIGQSGRKHIVVKVLQLALSWFRRSREGQTLFPSPNPEPDRRTGR